MFKINTYFKWKIDPFEERWKNTKLDDETYIRWYEIIAEPRRWNRGVAISFTILLYYRKVFTVLKLNTLPQEFEERSLEGVKQLHQQWFYDKDMKCFETQAVLGAMVDGDVRGQYANDLVWGFFLKLYKEDEDGIKKHIPLMYARLKETDEMVERNKEQYSNG